MRAILGLRQLNDLHFEWSSTRRTTFQKWLVEECGFAELPCSDVTSSYLEIEIIDNERYAAFLLKNA